MNTTCALFKYRRSPAKGRQDGVFELIAALLESQFPFPAPILVSSQPPLTLVPKNMMPLSGRSHITEKKIFKRE